MTRIFRVSAVALVAAALAATFTVVRTTAGRAEPTGRDGDCRGIAQAIAAGPGRRRAKPPARDGIVGLAALTHGGARHTHSPADPLAHVEIVNGDERTARGQHDLLFIVRGDGDVSLAGCVARDTEEGAAVSVPVQDRRPDLPALVVLDSVTRGGRLYDQGGLLVSAPVAVGDQLELAAGAWADGGKPPLGSLLVGKDGHVVLDRGTPADCPTACRPAAVAVFDLRANRDGTLGVRRIHHQLAPMGATAEPVIALPSPRRGTLRLVIAAVTFEGKYAAIQANRLF